MNLQPPTPSARKPIPLHLCKDDLISYPDHLLVRVHMHRTGYAAFDSPVGVEEFVKTHPHACEVLRGGRALRPYLDIDLSEDVLSVLQQYTAMEIAAEVVDVFASTFAAYYLSPGATPPHVAVFDSSGELPNGQYKGSFHAVVCNYAVSDVGEAQRLAKRTSDMLRLEIQGLPIIDPRVYANWQLFRLLHCTKPDDTRVKRVAEISALQVRSAVLCSKISYSDSMVTFTDNVIAIVGDGDTAGAHRRLIRNSDRNNIHIDAEEIKHAFAVANDDHQSQDTLLEPPQPMYASLRDFVLANAHQIGVLKAHELRTCNHTLFKFKRLKPSHCEFCERVHERDNTVLLQVANGKLFLGCFKSSNRRVVVRVPKHLIEKQPLGDKIVAKPYVSSKLPSQEYETPNGLTLTGFDSLPSKISYSSPELADYDLTESLVVQAGVGMGKTKMLRKYISDNIDRFEHIIFVSFRMSFAEELVAKYTDLDLVMYSTIRDRLISLRKYPRVVVQVESLHRLDLTKICCMRTLFVLDESESIFGQLTSNLHRQRPVAINKFKWLLHNAKYCVALDANLTRRSYTLLSKYRPGELQFHRNTFQNGINQTWHLVDDRAMFLTNMTTTAKHMNASGKDENAEGISTTATPALDRLLSEVRRIVFVSNSKSYADTTARWFADNRPDLRVMLITRTTPLREKVEFFRNINEELLKYDVFIYTPTLTAGVSFEQKHFDELHAYATWRSCDPWSFFQMLFRVRDISSRQYFACISSVKDTLPVTRAEIEANLHFNNACMSGRVTANLLQVEFDERGHPRLADSFALDLFIENEIVANRSRNDYKAEFKALLANAGVQFAAFPEYSSVDKKVILRGFRRLQDTVTREAAEALANTPVLPHEQIVMLRKRQESGRVEEALEEHEERAVRLYDLLDWYDLADTGDFTVTTEWVLEYSKRDKKRHYKNLIALRRVLLADDNANKAPEDVLRIYVSYRREQLARAESYRVAPLHEQKLNDEVRVLQNSAEKCRLALQLVQACGFSHVFDERGMSKSQLLENIQTSAQLFTHDCIRRLRDMFKFRKPVVSSFDVSNATHIKQLFRAVVGFVYGVELARKSSSSKNDAVLGIPEKGVIVLKHTTSMPGLVQNA